MSVTPSRLSPSLAHKGQGNCNAAPALSGQVLGTQLEAAQTALSCVRMALLISATPEEQSACMRAFVSQANRVMDLSGWEAPE